MHLSIVCPPGPNHGEPGGIDRLGWPLWGAVCVKIHYWWAFRKHCGIYKSSGHLCKSQWMLDVNHVRHLEMLWRFMKVQCNLDFPDLIYLESRLSGLAPDPQIH